MKTYNLSSTPMFYTPGMIRWIKSLPLAQARKIFKAGWPTIPARVRDGVIMGSIEITVDTKAGTVSFTA